MVVVNVKVFPPVVANESVESSPKLLLAPSIVVLPAKVMVPLKVFEPEILEAPVPLTAKVFEKVLVLELEFIVRALATVIVSIKVLLVAVVAVKIRSPEPVVAKVSPDPLPKAL